jgi:hypothetical protein
MCIMIQRTPMPCSWRYVPPVIFVTTVYSISEHEGETSGRQSGRGKEVQANWTCSVNRNETRF